MPEEYIKRICVECELVIHSLEDEDKVRGRSNKTDYFHKECLGIYESKIKAEKKNRSKGGQPTKMTDEVKTLLEEAFLANCNKTEACLNAGICTKTLERYIEKNPEYSLKIEQMRSNPRFQAKMIQGKELKDKNTDTAKYVLSHTDDEYQPKQKLAGKVDIGKTLLEQIIDKKKRKKDAE